MFFKLKKREKKKEKSQFRGDSGFTYSLGYVDTDAYLFLGKGRMVRAIFDITFAYGTHNPDSIGWVTKLIPSEYIRSGQIVIVQRQKGVDKSTENKIFEKTLASSMATIENSKESDFREKSKNSTRITDLMLAAELAKNNAIIDSDLMLIVKADSTKKVEKVIHELKLNYKSSNIDGVTIVRRTGEQLKSLETLLTTVHGDIYHNTDMKEVAADRLLLPSAGFADKYGVSIGKDTHSYISNNPAVVDFSTIRNAIIYVGDNRPFVSIGGYEGGSFMQNGGTALSHVIADGQYLNGGRTHHIVLTPNGYHAGDSLIFDMAKESINPLEVFGTPDTVVQDTNANIDKVTTMLLMAADAENNAYIKSNLKKQLIEWITYRAKGTGIYTDDPEHNPVKAQRILATDNHENYPVPADFLLSMNTNKAAAANSSAAESRDAKLMYDTMSTLVSTYPMVFDKTTTLPNVFKADNRNIYYDLSNLGEDTKLIAIVFLNIIAYVTHRALPGETICIDGIDEIELPVETLGAYRKRMNSKGINLISVFNHLERKVNPVSYESFVGRLNQQDMVVLGALTENDEKIFSKAWQQTLPTAVAGPLKSGNNGIFYFYRKRDRIGALVDTHLIL